MSEPLNTAQQRAVIHAVADAIEAHYVDSARGLALAEHLRDINTTLPDEPEAFADALTAEMQRHTPDKHLNLTLNRPPVRRQRPAAAEGLKRMEILTGNIGLLELREFTPHAANFLSAAMQIVSETSALILDFRDHRGGDSDTEAFFLGFFCPERTLISTFHQRGSQHAIHHWTPAFTPGPRYLNRPVVILTSHVTGSGAESFAYFMKHSGQAVPVGETTSGAAHPGEFIPVHSLLKVFVPSGRPESALTGENWEGVGVEPHHPVPAASALQKALELLIELLQAR